MRTLHDQSRERGRRRLWSLALCMVVAAGLVAPSGLLASGGPKGVEIRSIAPAAAPRGEVVAVTGRGFGGENVRIRVGRVAAQVLPGAGGDLARFVVPSAAAIGPTRVRVTNPGGWWAEIPFTVTDPAPFDGTVLPAADPTGTVSAEIGPEGGTLATGDGRFRLDIPALALVERVTITMTPLASLGGLPGGASLIGGVRLQPDGLRFFRPATLTLAMPTGVDPGQAVGFSYEGAGTGFHLVPRRSSAGTVAISVAHFSGAGAVAADPSQLDALLAYQPTPAEERANQELAALLYGREAEASGGLLNPDIATILRRWYTSSVRPGLLLATGGSQEFVELALGDWVAWLAAIALNNGEAPAVDPVEHLLAAERTEAAGLARDMTVDLARRILSRCTGPAGLDDAIRDALRLENVVTAVYPHLLAQDVASRAGALAGTTLPWACFHVEITEVRHTATLARFLDNTIAVRAEAVFFNGPRRTDVPLSFAALVGSPEERVVASSEEADGEWEWTVRPVADDGDVFARSLRVDLSGAPENANLYRVLGADGLLSLPVRDRVELAGRRPSDPVFRPTQVANVEGGTQVDLRVRLAGADVAGRAVTLELTGPGSLSATGGTTNADGELLLGYQAPPTPDADATVTLTATFDDDGSQHVATLVLLFANVTVSPSSVELEPGDSVQFSASVSIPDTTVTWSATGGSITDEGRYTAGATPGRYTVTATVDGHPGLSATAGVRIEVPAGRLRIVTDELPDGKVGEPYQAEIDVDATMPFDLTLEGGDPLPEGLSLVGTVISGTPTEFTFANLRFVATARDGTANDAKVLSLGIEPAWPTFVGTVTSSSRGASKVCDEVWCLQSLETASVLILVEDKRGDGGGFEVLESAFEAALTYSERLQGSDGCPTLTSWSWAQAGGPSASVIGDDSWTRVQAAAPGVLTATTEVFSNDGSGDCVRNDGLSRTSTLAWEIGLTAECTAHVEGGIVASYDCSSMRTEDWGGGTTVYTTGGRLVRATVNDGPP